MIPEIEYFVDNYLVEDIRPPVKSAFELFEQLELENFNDPFIEILMAEGDIERTGIADVFLETLNQTFTDILTKHGIVLNVEVSLEFKTKILQGILELPFYQDVTSILRILEGQADPVEKLAEALTFVTDLQETEIILNVESIENALLTKLQEIILDKEDDFVEDEEDTEWKNKIISKLKLLKGFLNYDKAVGFTLVDNSIILGSEFDQYSSYAVKHFDVYEPDVVAKELFVLLTLSKEGYENPLITYRKYSQNLFSDLDRITKIDIQLSKLLMEFDKYKLNLKTVEAQALC